MRFIHIADMHFDSPFRFIGENGNLGDIRRLEQRQVFKKIIEYIYENKIPYLFISGDLYEQEYIRKTTIEYINNLFKTIPETKIFIAPGNHDPLLKNSYYNTFEWNDNVYIFNSEIQNIELEDVDIYGFGFEDFYCLNSNIENIKIKNKEKINILIMHGSINASEKLEMQYNPINEKILIEKKFEYIALGHIHKRQYINNNIVYPGSTISFGFDELGSHGMLDVNLEKNNLKIDFIELDNRIFKEEKIDISEIKTQEELIEKIATLKLEKNTMYKIILIGTREIEIEENKILKLINRENILKIKNNTDMNYNLNEIANQNNLRGIFVNELLKKLKNDEENEKIIKKAIEIGIKNLS